MAVFESVADNVWGSRNLDVVNTLTNATRDLGESLTFSYQSTVLTENRSNDWNFNKDSLIAPIESLFNISNYSKVSKFLTTNEYLYPVLFESVLEIYHVFGENVQLSIKIESDGEDEKLYVLIDSDMDFMDAFDFLGELDTNWWNENITKVNHKMNIDLEY